MANQDGLKLPESADQSGSLLAAFTHCIRYNGPRKQEGWVPILPGCHSAGHLSDVIAGRKHIPPPWLRKVATDFDPEHLIAKAVARWSGLSVRPPRVYTSAAFERAAKAVLARHNGMGAELLREIEAEALAEPETDEVAP